MDTISNIDAIYAARVQRFEGEAAAARGAFNRLGNVRLGLFFLTVACFIAGIFLKGEQWINLTMYIAGLAGVVLSLVLASRHQRLEEELARRERMVIANVRARHRLQREWKELPVPLAADAFTERPESHDLDLFGTGSLFHLVCTTHSPQGRRTLAKWLTASEASPDTLTNRQSCVQELAPQLEWRQQLGTIGEELGELQETDPAWLCGDTWLAKHPSVLLAARILPVLMVGLFVAAAFSAVPISWPIALLAAGAVLSRRHRKQLATSIQAILGQERAVHHYAELFAHVHSLEAKCPYLKEIHTNTSEAHTAFEEISAIGGNAGVYGSFVHPLLRAFLLWDFHVVHRIEKWQERYRGRLPNWFAALGEIEALTSLAGLAHDEPNWAYPEFSDEKTIVTNSLGHPLIAASARVSNDVCLGPPGNFVLVTGSNMSGKSTLLRSIGLNVALAQAGAPVCASSMFLPPVRLATSMRVQDSLNQGVSFFMAELQRMREIVSAAIDTTDGRMVLYLLDEILQGTNTVERQAIVERIVKRLLGCHAIGAITTHDLALAEVDTLSQHAQLVHFREEFYRDEAGRPQMTFDYQLRPGLATTTNALKILEVIDMPV